MGHVKMMAAAQPFISGAISKTVNVPEHVTTEEIEDTYLQAWRLGLKAIAIYRDNSKRTQPLSTGRTKDEGRRTEDGPDAEALAQNAEGLTAVGRPYRRKLPDERQSITHKFSVGGHEGYVTVGRYEDGMPGEIFVTMSKEGSTISGLMDAFATMVSFSLQYGVPLEFLVKKFAHTRFEPSGWTGNKQIPIAKSILDYIFRWMALKFLPPEQMPEEEKSMANGHGKAATAAAPSTNGNGTGFALLQEDAPPCSDCGSIMVRSGACYRCLNCGATSGCG
jgi:ribonucleoside-diphosphate reductase alpha chain